MDILRTLALTSYSGAVLRTWGTHRTDATGHRLLREGL